MVLCISLERKLNAWQEYEVFSYGRVIQSAKYGT